jgi:hypothetical protein
MSTYAARSSYEFSESPKKSPMRASPTPIDPETPSKSAFSCTPGFDPSLRALPPIPSLAYTHSCFLSYSEAFLSNKWGAFTTKASEVAQKARGRLHEIVQSSPSTPADNSYEGPGTSYEDCTLSLKEAKTQFLTLARLQTLPSLHGKT